MLVGGCVGGSSPCWSIKLQPGLCGGFFWGVLIHSHPLSYPAGVGTCGEGFRDELPSLGQPWGTALLTHTVDTSVVP